MPRVEEVFERAKQYDIERFGTFELVDGRLWAPAYIKNKWRILTLDLDTARQGAGNVFALCGDGGNVVSLVRAAMKRRDQKRMAG